MTVTHTGIKNAIELNFCRRSRTCKGAENGESSQSFFHLLHSQNHATRAARHARSADDIGLEVGCLNESMIAVEKGLDKKSV